METYHNIPLDVALLRKEVLIKRLPILAITFIIGLGAFFLTAGKAPVSPIIYLILSTVILCVFIINTIRSINNEAAIYNSYSLTITEDSLIRKQDNLPTMSILLSNIDQITETKHGHLIIKTQPPGVIVVRSTVEQYNDIKNLLNAIKPISPVIYKTTQKLMFLVPLFCIALMAGVYISNNKVIVLTSGTILAALLSWSFYKIRTNKSIDARIKRSLWSMPIILLSIIAIVYYKVFVK